MTPATLPGLSDNAYSNHKKNRDSKHKDNLRSSIISRAMRLKRSVQILTNAGLNLTMTLTFSPLSSRQQRQTKGACRVDKSSHTRLQYTFIISKPV